MMPPIAACTLMVVAAPPALPKRPAPAAAAAKPRSVRRGGGGGVGPRGSGGPAGPVPLALMRGKDPEPALARSWDPSLPQALAQWPWTGPVAAADRSW